MRSHSYINSARSVISTYDGSVPFAVWIKQFFKNHKKYGSKDRKEITHLCYSYFRLGKAFENLPIEERILIGVFLSSSESNFVLGELKPQWNAEVPLPLREKIRFLNVEQEIKTLFPFADELSKEIDAPAFRTSFLVQPLLYLRIRPGKQEAVANKLQMAGMDFERIDQDCMALANSSKTDEVIHLNAEAVVQDRNSQKVLELLQAEIRADQMIKAWDCCAASGGKSILLKDHFARAELTVSDVRESILVNLRKRFQQAGISGYHSFVADVSSRQFSFPESFDLVICDVPCSGSGTWSRTPEQLLFFKKEKIEHYAQLQQAIALNAAKSVKQGGYLLYITCSVFQKENEEVATFIQNHTAVQLVSWQYLKGYEKRADSLFAALFRL